MKLTAKQKQAIKLLRQYKYCLFYGGARSGKTFSIIYYIIYISLKFPGARSLVARRYAVDVKGSIFKDTLVKVLDALDLHEGPDYKSNTQDMEIHFSNGSHIICAGLDDKERVDKVLGKEYAIIYANEVTDIPWPTILRMRARLAQKITGYINQLIVDLNPESSNHWTYKIWFRGIDPETQLPLEQTYDLMNEETRELIKTIQLYGKLHSTAYDNKENLSVDYIHNELEVKIGNDRKRFLEGVYNENTDLMVFQNPHAYKWEEFLAWGNAYTFTEQDRDAGFRPRPPLQIIRWTKVHFVGGLDLGYQDADAFCIMAYADDSDEAWVVFEHKARRATMQELAATIKQGLNWVYTNVPNMDKDISIYCDTATVRYGHEGNNKKVWTELRDAYGLPLMPAYKRDKRGGIEFLQDILNGHKLHIPFNGAMHDETAKIIWTRNDDGSIIREIDDEAFHPDMMDAVLYPVRYLMSYGIEAWRRYE